MSRLTIQNLTDYRTDDLKRLLYGAIEFQGARKFISHAEFSKARLYEMKGFAWPEEGRIEIRIPKGFSPQKDKLELAQLLVHELEHLMGGEHSEMPPLWEQEMSWHEGFELRLRKGVKVDEKKALYERIIRECTLALWGFPEAAPLVTQILECDEALAQKGEE